MDDAKIKSLLRLLGYKKKEIDLIFVGVKIGRDLLPTQNTPKPKANDDLDDILKFISKKSPTKKKPPMKKKAVISTPKNVRCRYKHIPIKSVNNLEKFLADNYIFTYDPDDYIDFEDCYWKYMLHRGCDSLHGMSKERFSRVLDKTCFIKHRIRVGHERITVILGITQK